MIKDLIILFFNLMQRVTKPRGCQPPVLLLLEGKKKRIHDESDEELEYAGNLCPFAVDAIDEYSRFMFPLAFCIFNTIYWLYFFSQKGTRYSWAYLVFAFRHLVLGDLVFVLLFIFRIEKNLCNYFICYCVLFIVFIISNTNGLDLAWNFMVFK